LPAPRPFEAAGGVAAWIDESVALCREGLAPLFERTAGDAAFLDQRLDHGEIDPSSRDAPEGWKAQNVHAYRGAR